MILETSILFHQQADIQKVKDAVGSAVDVMQALGSSICTLLSKVNFYSLIFVVIFLSSYGSAIFFSLHSIRAVPTIWSCCIRTCLLLFWFAHSAQAKQPRSYYLCYWFYMFCPWRTYITFYFLVTAISIFICSIVQTACTETLTIHM